MYLPPAITEDIAFPIALGKDFYLQVRLIEEKFSRFFDTISYQQILKQVTMEPGAPYTEDGAVPVGEIGTTAYDPLYGEAVDPEMAINGAWQQPHLSGTLKASNPELYAAAIGVKMRIQVTVQDIDLHHYGFEKIIDLIASVPVSLLDKAGITCQPGDVFTWGGDIYKVQQIGPSNRYLNTTTLLYLYLNCARKRQGS